MAKLSKSQLRKFAFHEAGHTVVNFSVGIRVHYVKIAKEYNEGDEVAGETRTVYEEWETENPEFECMASLGGFVAECILQKRKWTLNKFMSAFHAMDDFTQTYEYAKLHLGDVDGLEVENFVIERAKRVQDILTTRWPDVERIAAKLLEEPLLPHWDLYAMFPDDEPVLEKAK